MAKWETISWDQGTRMFSEDQRVFRFEFCECQRKKLDDQEWLFCSLCEEKH